MKRLFTQKQRNIIAWLSGGYCNLCKSKLTNDFHADHIFPFSKGGKTVIQNGQALCPSCNLKKGSS